MLPEQTAHRGHLLAYGSMIGSRDFKNDAGIIYVIEEKQLVPLFPPISLPEGKLPHLHFTNIGSPEVDLVLNSALVFGGQLTEKNRTPKEVADAIKTFLDNELPKLPGGITRGLCVERGSELDIVTLLYKDQTEAHGGYPLYSGIPTLEDFTTPGEVVAS